MNKKQNNPSLRFPQFQNPWFKKTLSEVCLINPKTLNFPETFLYIDLESVSQGRIVKKPHLMSKGKAPSRAQLPLSVGDIIFQRVRPYQKNNYIYTKEEFEYPVVASSGYCHLRMKEDNSQFLFQVMLTERFVKKVLQRCTGTSYPEISNSDLRDIEFGIPPLPEQQKIASFFSLLDQRIEKQQEKISCLEEYKKGLMQKIFSQVIRFKDENGEDYPEWEEIGFKLLFLSVPTKKYQILSSEVSLAGKYEVVDQGASNILGHCNIDQKLFKHTPVIIYGDHTTVVKYRSQPFVVGADGVKLLKNKRKIDDIKYLFYALQQRNIKPEGYKRHFPILKGIALPICALAEQQKIGQFMSNIDELIEKNNEFLEQWKLLKKGLLQQMFI